MVADLARLERRPPETFVVPGEGRGNDHGAHPLEAHALALIVLRFRRPGEESRHVLGHLFRTNEFSRLGGAVKILKTGYMRVY